MTTSSVKRRGRRSSRRFCDATVSEPVEREDASYVWVYARQAVIIRLTTLQCVASWVYSARYRGAQVFFKEGWDIYEATQHILRSLQEMGYAVE